MPRPNRRTLLKGLTSALALGTVGTTSGHPTEEHPALNQGHDIHRHRKSDGADLVGYHSLGGIGSESMSGKPEDAMHGMITETWLEGDLGFVAIQSSSAPTGNRGVAILDISAYTRAETRDELDRAEMTVLSFIGNESEAGTGNDVKVSDDGQYLAYSKQAIGATYGEYASASTEDQDAPGPNVTGAEVYDISDPGNPEYVGSAQGPNVGFHNCFIHQIGGDHYVFGIQGAVAGDAAVHIYRITDGGVVPVNVWGGGDLPVTGYGTDAALYYCHDFYAENDPKTGKPLGYIAYWDNGVVVLDLSDPTDITALGRGKMNVAHYAQPVPDTVGGKRLFVGGQERSSSSGGKSGDVNVFDLDALIEGEGETIVDSPDGIPTVEPLATYRLYDNVDYEGYAFSPHNNDIVVADDGDAWITQAHYHAGVRFLKIQPPSETGDGWHIAGRRVRSTNGEPIRQETADVDGDGEEELVREFETNDQGVFTSGFENARLEEAARAYYSSHLEVPEETKTERPGLLRTGTPKSPDYWSARTLNGVTFGASQHTGFYAIAADPMEVGTRTPADVSVTRSDDGRVFTSGQTNRIDYEIETDEPVPIRDRLPAGWEVVGGDAVTTYDTGDGLRVEFDEPVGPTGAGPTTRSMFVTVGGTANQQVGPVQFATDDDPSRGGKDWETLADSVGPVLVGPSQ